MVNAYLFMAPQSHLLVAPSGITSLLLIVAFLVILSVLVIALSLYRKIMNTQKLARQTALKKNHPDLKEYINTLNSNQIEVFLNYLGNKDEEKSKINKTGILGLTAFLFLMFSGEQSFSQTTASTGGIWTEGGIIITLVLLLIPVIVGIWLMISKTNNLFKQYQLKQASEDADELIDIIDNEDKDELKKSLKKRQEALDYKLSHRELSGNITAEDTKGLLQQVDIEADLPVVSLKKRAIKRPPIDPALAKLILWFIGTAAFWLIFGTTVGEYLGIKFVAPDVDQLSFLSFGRLRPVHTNAVFWGWASLGMLGLGYYVVPRVSNAPLKSIKMGWYTLILINITVVLGTICLMSGINNGGGEYREYIWPVMLMFGIGLILTLINFIGTIAQRTTKEIYISNWYIVASVIFAIVISFVAYIPTWQDGLGETIIQGYYMHQGVGMWFMLFMLGVVYYFLPQQLNKPIYSYSLGILAFWTQILFYTVIGTHHFVFSSIPWWLQTTAIVGSMGMVIPVAAGTTNFLLTFKGSWYKIPSSYTLPFFIIGIIFYFTGSLQGTAEAFRSTNLIWHFTDFTVAHSHLTMYGIICFFLWAGIYAVVPRLTGKEAPQITVGAHFWLALIGLLIYTVPLMYGSTLRGMMWVDKKPFIDTVVFMAPYWLWRAIGGSLMWLSHIFFAYNFYKMLTGTTTINASEVAIQKLNENTAHSENSL
ncbi:cytochrome oxidase subunit I [Pedobacter changchengzhani]|uniref:Cytochrome oxidase subunit I n=1 Tax=Pedobacter changchengzhani TaxID=2529274 RepID=A0A4R5MJQ5_9SPHI|nr:cbb3-type cytochrome c oxidase subunit I [Pedobacter changchengzhani]TDG35897.1 cytochrome oxidase subunit I [Pedobacter changchengzhani]